MIDINLHRPQRMTVSESGQHAWITIETDSGKAAVFVPARVAHLTADAFNAAMEAEREPDTEANVRSAMATATSLADDFATLTNAQIRALAKEVAG